MNYGRPAALALVALACAAAGAAPSTLGAPPRLHVALLRALEAPGIDPRRTAALAVDLSSGQPVFADHADLPLLPASAEKLAISFTALRALGPAYRFRTEVVGSGELQRHVWNGDLALVGYGDPTLAPADLEILARDVAGWGVRRVTGNVLGDEGYFDSRRDAPGWKPTYVGIESRPLSALSVATVRFSGIDGSAAAAARAFSRALERHGVAVDGSVRAGRAPTPADGLPLAVDLSEPLATIVRHMNRESDNFVAEMLLKELGVALAGHGTTRAGARVVHSTLATAGIPLDGVRTVDGSGLSLRDRLTPRALVAILRAGTDDRSIHDAFVTSLAVAGISGTLEKRLGRRPTRGRVIAKTGTTNAASALAGFVRRRYVFAVIQNGSPVPYWTARAAQDRFVTVLARS